MEHNTNPAQIAAHLNFNSGTAFMALASAKLDEARHALDAEAERLGDRASNAPVDEPESIPDMFAFAAGYTFVEGSAMVALTKGDVAGARSMLGALESKPAPAKRTSKRTSAKAKPETKTEAAPEPQVESKPEPKPEPAPEPAPAVQVESKPEPTPEPQITLPSALPEPTQPSSFGVANDPWGVGAQVDF